MSSDAWQQREQLGGQLLDGNHGSPLDRELAAVGAFAAAARRSAAATSA